MDVCATDSVESLIKEFTTNFGTEINGIIKGKTLTNLNTLRQIYLPKHQEFFQANMTIDRLRKEFPLLSSIDGTLLLLAEYLYKSELAMQTTAIKFYEEDAINAAANELIMLSESLKFLKYGTAREKFNPSNVFKEKDSRMLGEEIENNEYFSFASEQIKKAIEDSKKQAAGSVLYSFIVSTQYPQKLLKNESIENNLKLNNLNFGKLLGEGLLLFK